MTDLPDSSRPAPGSGDLAGRLAAWLEELGLADQLAAAGLPTYERDDDGTVRWTDPATGEPLPEDRLAELDALLRSEGEDPTHAVPIALVRLRREGRVRAALLDGGWVDYAEVGRLRGISELSRELTDGFMGGQAAFTAETRSGMRQTLLGIKEAAEQPS